IMAAERGYQTAFMAPTEILARQHFHTMTGLLERLGDTTPKPSIGLLTGNESGRRAGVASGEIAIIFGTHALIQKSVGFKNLGLVVIDEQHRFGVRQRQ